MYLRFYFFLIFLLSVVGCSGRDDFEQFGDDLIGKRLVVEEQLFVLRYKAFTHCLVEPPGRSSHVPPTVGLYLKYPENWMEVWEARRTGVSVNRDEVQILGILEPGTIVFITDYDTTHSFVGDIYAPLGKIEAPEYAGMTVEFFGLFEGLGAGDYNPRPNPEYLRQVK